MYVFIVRVVILVCVRAGYCLFAEHTHTDILYTQHDHKHPTSHMVHVQLLCYQSTDTDVSTMLMGVQMLSVSHPVAPSPLPFLVLPPQKERRELEQTNAELHQKLFDMEAELEKLRPFKDQATSVSEHTHVRAHTHTHTTHLDWLML